MGPAMNLILAVVLLAIVLINGAPVPAYQGEPPVVGPVPAGSPAAAVGIQPGDRILAIDGHDVETWDDLFNYVSTHAGHAIPITFSHAGQTIRKEITPEGKGEFEFGDIGVLPDVHPSIQSVQPGSPAEQAGLKTGDSVLAVNGRPITFARQLSQALAPHGGEAVAIEIARNGSKQTLQVTPKPSGKTAIIGVGIGDAFKTFKPGVVEAIGLSVQKNYEGTILIGETLWGLITRQVSAKQLMGPVAIAQLSGQSAEAGWVSLLSLMAILSLNLGLLNLLPIPVLDGGHIFVMVLEGIARRDFSVAVKERVFLAGFVFLMMLMVMVIYNDLARLPWFSHILP
jgi:regulator of sigma E protease